MLKLIVRSVVCLALFGNFAGVAPAAADPIVVTGGSFTSTLSSSSFTFTGDGLRLSGSGNGIASSLFDCTPCTPDPSKWLSFSGTLEGAQLGGGEPGEFQGVHYDHTYLAGSIFFDGPSFRFAQPAENIPPGGVWEGGAPFTMRATISNYASGVISTSEPPLFTVSLIGRGTATARGILMPGNPQLFTIQNVTYQFTSDNATPTPEPASMILLGTGLAGMLVRRHRGQNH